MNDRTNLNTLFSDAELPFGHPGPNYDDSPADHDRFDDRYEPPPADPPEESIVHYGPGDQPLCGNESHLAVYTNDANQVAGCVDCLLLIAEDLDDDNQYAGRCLHCRQEISAQGGVAWRKAVRSPCPHCDRAGW